jgi:hypothetical protein
LTAAAAAAAAADDNDDDDDEYDGGEKVDEMSAATFAVTAVLPPRSPKFHMDKP